MILLTYKPVDNILHCQQQIRGNMFRIIQGSFSYLVWTAHMSNVYVLAAFMRGIPCGAFHAGHSMRGIIKCPVR